MSDETKCCECGTPVSYETGFSISGTLAEGSQDHIYCPEHAPDQGRGYTLSDLQKMRGDNQAVMAKYRISQIDRVGPDVYFAVTNPEEPS